MQHPNQGNGKWYAFKSTKLKYYLATIISGSI